MSELRKLMQEMYKDPNYLENWAEKNQEKEAEQQRLSLINAEILPEISNQLKDLSKIGYWNMAAEEEIEHTVQAIVREAIYKTFKTLVKG
jgi:hypothetical protein